MLNFLLAIILTRSLGPDGIGQYEVIQGVMVLVPQLVCLGLPMSYLYHVQKDKASQGKYLYQATIGSLFMGLIGAMCLGLAILFFKGYFGQVKGYALLPIMLYVTFVLQRSVARSSLLVSIEARLLSIIEISACLVSVVLASVLVLTKVINVELALLCFVSAACVRMILGWAWTYRAFDTGCKFDGSIFKRMAVRGVKLSFADLMIIVNNQVSIVLIRLLLDDFASVGYYTRGLRIATLIITAVQSVLPLLFSRWAEIDEKQVPVHFAKVMRFTTAISLVFLLVVLVSGKWLILIMFGSHFLPATVPMIILLPGAILFLLSRIHMELLGSRGVPELSGFALLATSLLNAVLCFIFIPKMGIAGACCAFTIGNVCLFILLVIIVKKRYAIEIRKCLLLNRKDIDDIKKTLPTFMRGQKSCLYEDIQ
jgi:O-antigen/teichoic acid export membrane protein